MGHASWLSPLFEVEKLKLAAKTLAKEINKDKRKMNYKYIAVTGISGVTIGGLLSYKTNLPLIIVRKQDGSHSGYNVEYNPDGVKEDSMNYCIVDDLIASGNTVKRIMQMVSEKTSFRKVTLKKIYLYSDYEKSEWNMDGTSYPVSCIDLS